MRDENFSIVTDQLAVGEAPSAEMLRKLAHRGYTAIVDIRSEASDSRDTIEELGIAYLHVSVDDTRAPTMDQIAEIFAFVEPLLDEGRRIYVHCQNGYGRSPLAIAAILMYRGTPLAEALDLLHDKHPLTTLMPSQHLFLRYLDEELLKRRSHAR